MGDGYRTISEQGVASALLPGNQSLRTSIRALDTKGPKRKHGKWRARPLDHTGNAFFPSSGGSGMSPSWRQDTSGPQGKSSPCRNQMGGLKEQGDSNHPGPVDPDDTLFG